MQRVTHCMIRKEDHCLLLQKPRRGWWVAPGGKMELGESVKEAVTREVYEETGLIAKNPAIKGIFTILVKDGERLVMEWMLFTFLTTDFEGDPFTETEEGVLDWKHVDEIPALPMAEGDLAIFEHVLHGSGILYGTFTYTEDYQLLSMHLDKSE